MSLTLDELKVIDRALNGMNRICTKNFKWEELEDLKHSITLIHREIRLKETDFVTMKKIDAQGNPIDNDGN